MNLMVMVRITELIFVLKVANNYDPEGNVEVQNGRKKFLRIMASHINIIFPAWW
ncbi:hypothetical protein [Bacteroides xylanisolvens]|uniref:hypothetical protein n=1 Tax=Bacteroides xylanisolvens TaxID=371601 RepID=UPI0021659D3E|nr:hypothetical protein [Bacteroides xylanisolvens]MCS2626518.1 hypothetical protein [Bacteroides xylanisolvens]